ncbi:MAG TPA: DUF6152 family protein [Alphaproteobacteria bacterium]|nr:DUF6152 family protein [Alphaproteobacteria bacterium]
MKTPAPARLCAIGLVTALPAVLPAWAHHGWSSYDAETVLVLEAPILAARYQNPHGEIEMEAEGTRWLVTLAPPARMERRGLSREQLVPGKTVTVEGYPSREHEDEMRAERITIDGSTIELR